MKKLLLGLSLVSLLLTTQAQDYKSSLEVYPSDSIFYTKPLPKYRADKPYIRVECFCIGNNSQMRNYLVWLKTRNYRVVYLEMVYKDTIEHRNQYWIIYDIRLQ